MKLRLISPRLFVALLPLAALALPPSRAAAQAEYTAARPAELLVFGGYTHVQPDYGTTNNNGVVFGADYLRSFGWLVVPGLEFRANINSGKTVSQHTYTVGLRGGVNFHQRYHFYGDFLVGPGYTHYPIFVNGSYQEVPDGGRVFSIGGGADIDLTDNFLFKADFQVQEWNLGPNSNTNPNGSDFTLSPTALTLGISYRIPFKPWVSHRYEPR